MRLLKAEGTGAGVLACLYCGAETESRPPYEVMYCYCRSARDAAPARREHGAPSLVGCAA